MGRGNIPLSGKKLREFNIPHHAQEKERPGLQSNLDRAVLMGAFIEITVLFDRT